MGAEKEDSALSAFAQGIDLKEILAFLEETDLDFLSVEKGGRRLALRRPVGAVSSSNLVVQESEKTSFQEPEVPKALSVRSPIVGRFFRAAGQERPPFVLEGGHVSVGQKLAIVEAMKIKKEVISTYAGTVVRVFVRDGDPVEYGQELFSIELDPSQNSGSAV